jgi:hypothetical protein
VAWSNESKGDQKRRQPLHAREYRRSPQRQTPNLC